MSKKLYSAGAGALVLALLVLDLNVAVLSQGIQRTYEESGDRLDNPGRGFYVQVDSGRPEKISEAAEDARLILLAFDLEDCARGEIPQEKLEELRTALDRAEQEHMSVIFRAAYGFGRNAKEPDSLETVRGHIRQMCGVLNEYSALILVVQAGMLGEYGEWHTSRYLRGSEEECRENRLYVLRQWEEFLDSGIKVAVRRPRFVREAQAQGVLPGRLGVHNDALLSTDSDMGTYDDPEMDREKELLWMEARLADQCNGGEMPTPGALNAPQNADREFYLMHLSYLNLKYNKEIISNWSQRQFKSENAKSYLENHLGYRLYLSQLDMDLYHLRRWAADSKIDVQLTFVNSGYGRLPEKYQVFLTADNGEEQITRAVPVPELNRISNGQSSKVTLTWELPREFVKDREEIRLGFKIAAEEDAEERDCVKLANSGFDCEEGTYALASLQQAHFTWLEASV